MSSLRTPFQRFGCTKSSVGTLLVAPYSLAAWIGYQRELSAKVDRRVQLNVRSGGEDSDLVADAVEPDGSVAQQRIVGGATYGQSMKAMF